MFTQKIFELIEAGTILKVKNLPIVLIQSIELDPDPISYDHTVPFLVEFINGRN